MLGELIMYDPLISPVVFFIAGIFLAFRGRKLVPFALAVCSLVIGFLYGSAIIANFTDNPDFIRWGPVLLGVVLAVLVNLLYKIAFFAAGAVLGFFLSGVVIPEASVLVTAGISIITGALVYFFRNFVFSVLTAVLGAVLFATGAVNLVAWTGISAGRTIYMVTVVVISLLGAVYQLRNGRKS